MKISELPALKLLFGVSIGIFSAFWGGYSLIGAIVVLFVCILVLSQKKSYDSKLNSDVQPLQNDEYKKDFIYPNELSDLGRKTLKLFQLKTKFKCSRYLKC